MPYFLNESHHTVAWYSPKNTKEHKKISGIIRNISIKRKREKRRHLSIVINVDTQTYKANMEQLVDCLVFFYSVVVGIKFRFMLISIFLFVVVVHYTSTINCLLYTENWNWWKFKNIMREAQAKRSAHCKYWHSHKSKTVRCGNRFHLRWLLSALLFLLLLYMLLSFFTLAYAYLVLASVYVWL